MNIISARFRDFVLDDISTNEFEQWVYATSELEDICGSGLYSELISCDYRKKFEIDELRKVLRAWLESTYHCRCSLWRNRDSIPMLGDDWDIFEELEVLKRQTPWLDLARCTKCGEHWYVGNTDDDFYVCHLNSQQVDAILKENRWPEKELPDRYYEASRSWGSDEWFRSSGYCSIEDWQAKNGMLNDDLRKAYGLEGKGDRLTDFSVKDRAQSVKKALQLYQQAYAIASKHWADDHPEQTTRRSKIGEVLYEMGEFSAAAEIQEKVVEDFSRLVDEDNHTLQYLKLDLARSLKHLGELKRAEQLELSALETMRRLYPLANPNVAIVEEALAETRALKGHRVD